MTDAPDAVDLLTGPTAAQVLGSVLDAVGARLHEWDVRSVHQRGSSSVAVVYEVDLTDGRERRSDKLFVAHTSTRSVPKGAAELDVNGLRVHVWQFPHDPYMPGLGAAVNRAEAARLLRRLGLDDDEGTPAIRTRSYRPTRRAVVQLRPAAETPPAVYIKLLGGRDPRHRRRRTRRLVAVHDQLADALPVPRVLEHDLDEGRVALGALTGASLRSVLRDRGRLPSPTDLRDLLAGLHAHPALPGGADPDGYADVDRHVTRLRRHLPDRGDDLARVAAAAASVGGPRATVHGDLHDGQLLVEQGRVTGVLDVDGAGTGRVAHDLGRLLAHLDAGALTVPAIATRVTEYVGEVRDAVGALAPLQDIDAAAAGAWLGLATGPLRVASSRWRTEVTERVDRALRWTVQAGW